MFVMVERATATDSLIPYISYLFSNAWNKLNDAKATASHVRTDANDRKLKQLTCKEVFQHSP